MSIEKKLRERSGSICEMCDTSGELFLFAVPPVTMEEDKNIMVCNICFEQMSDVAKMDANHWRCLSHSMWSTLPAVQVMAWRLLNILKHEAWAQDLLDILYLDDETLTWAKASTLESDLVTEEKIVHRDCNGTTLQAGDTVVLIKDLDVKGAGFTAKRGTAVRGITLMGNNSNQIEGRVNGQQIVILTQFIKKS
ncbi:MAG TPA: PhnA domain-containing protein [Cyclobacteriaceae bacterium]|jgi:protein PhnA|nr:PhnA domain-containing protein [Cyclobacteriaceae bacterium]